ncbi:interferon-induced, double-stranded RNA-activated protein kinase-like isoform X2 [Betta splendens]|uniref:Interferon-induced, double-stranded RNA-activated protein kinase-like isoform X2 n=1 Tax=Betta splendens TaxID=158456 RepID=A0A6P7KM17_BETSP|nr:interferon-induced, double-stranded RNA-activated protein kinase-like isoform X2 [Betta splendens]
MEPGRYVARLNQFLQKRHCDAVVEYLECGEDGPPHEKIFTQRVRLNGVEYPDGVGRSKKEAKNVAAKYALECLEGQQDTDNAEILSSPQSNTFTGANFVGLVNHYCQVKHLHPKYDEEWKSGPSHNPQFLCRLVIENKEYPVCEGKNKKEARQRAAHLAWSALQEQSDFDSKVSLRSTCSDDSESATTSEPLVSSDAAMDISDPVTSKDSSKDQSMEQSVSDPSAQSRFTSDFDSMERLGKGGFGSVYKVRDKMLNKYWAVKIVAYHEKALDEAKILSDLQNKHIVRYYHCWKEDSKYEEERGDRSTYCSESASTSNMSSSQYLYIQMELCDSKTLRNWIDERNQRTEHVSKRSEDSLKIAQQVVTGVEYIHSKKLIHRDLKPDNIMFGGDGAVKIGDFGLVTAEMHDSRETSLERTLHKGTPSYMAPEQKIDPKYDHKVDIFALGLIYFEVIWKISTVHEKFEIWENVRSSPKALQRHFSKRHQ